jgi:hypothetical protein
MVFLSWTSFGEGNCNTEANPIITGGYSCGFP